MNFRTTYLLFGFLGVLLVLFVVAVWLGPSTDRETYLLSSAHDEKDKVDANDIVSVTIERTRPTSETLAFQREDKGAEWKMTKPHEYRVEDSTVTSVVNQVLAAKKDMKVPTNAHLGEAGLEPPAAVVTLQSKDGRQWKLNLGNEIKGEQSGIIYVTSSDHPSPAVGVKNNQLDTPFKPVNDFRSKDLMGSYAFDIKSVTLRDGKGADSKNVVMLEETGPSTWKFAQPDLGEADYNGTDAPADAKSPKNVSQLLEAVAGLKVRYKSATDNDFVEDGDDMSKYGLDKDAKGLRIEAKWTPSGKTKSVTDTLLIGKKADDKGEMVYARLESEKNVVKLPAKSLEPFTNLLDDPQVRERMRDHTLVQLDPGKTVDAIDIEGNDGKTFKLRREGKGDFGAAAWKIYREGSPPQTADAAAVDGLLNSLRFADPDTQKKKSVIQDFLPANTPVGKPLAVVTLWVDSLQKEEPKKDDKAEDKKDEKKADAKDAKKDEKKDEKKEAKKETSTEPPKMKPDAKPAYKLTFFLDPTAAQKKGIGVKREQGDKVTLATVPDSLADKVTAGPLAYRDKALPKLEGEVTQVVIDRGGDVWKLKQEKKDGKTSWKIEQPKDLAGGTADGGAVARLTGDLSFLRAEKLLDDKATPELEKKYGLDKPKAKVVLTTTRDGKSEEHAYVFGNDADAGTVYVEMGKDGPLFTVRKDLLSDVQGELRDKAVFNITPAKVKEMKLTGWYDAVGQLLGKPYVLDLEHKGLRDWTLKEASTKTFKQVDVDKAENFLDSVVNLQLKQFLTPKTAAKAEHKLDLEKDNALKIELVVEGEKGAKETYTLTVGGSPTGDNQSFYATSSRLPGEVFLVPSFPFEKVKNKGTEKDSGTPFYFQK
jgi:hypothetical protein